MVDTIQSGIEKGSEIYSVEQLAGSSDPVQTVVYVPAGTYLVEDDVKLKTGVHLKGADAATTILDADSGTRVMRMEEMFYITVENFTITNGLSGGPGAGIKVYDCQHVLITNNIITNNSTRFNHPNDGGGILFVESSGKIKDNTISNNISSGEGGGIYFWSEGEDDYVDVIGNTIDNNRSEYDGGGIYCEAWNQSNFNIIENSITNNYTDYNGEGGGVYAQTEDNTTCVIKSNTVSGNYVDSSGAGGGLYVEVNISDPGSATANVVENNVTGNYSEDGNGGGLYIAASYGGFATVTGNNISGNGDAASYDGGGVYIHCHGNATINNNNIDSNICGDEGYQLYFERQGSTPLNVDNNWWGTGVSLPDDTEVYESSNTSAIDYGTPATSAFPVPVTP